MLSKKIEKETTDKQSSTRRNSRSKSGNFPSEVYGARLKLDDAKILDDYGKKHNLERSDVVRVGLHHFALHQQMLVRVADAESELQESKVSEEIASLKAQLDELSQAINNLTAHFSNNKLCSLSSHISDDSDVAKSRDFNNEFTSNVERVFTEQMQMLERILLTVTIAFRLYVNYMLEPVLRPIANKESELPAHLDAADKGRENWSQVMQTIFEHTRDRVILDMTLAPEQPKSKPQNQQQ